MLYDCWKKVAESKKSEPAIWDMSEGRIWRFQDLLNHGDQGCRQTVAHPRGNTVGFILTLLQAWRQEIPVCPLETHEKEPLFPSKPPGCHVKLTSATTGPSRMIVFSGEQLRADATNLVQTMGLRPDWPNLAAISLAHSYGFSNLVLPLLLHGVPLILAPSALPEMMKSAATGHACVTLPGVPALWRAWLEAGAIPKNVKLAISAGAPLGLELEHAVFDRCGLKIHNFYGASECGGIAYDRSETPRNRADCVGSPVQNVDLTCTGEGCLTVTSKAVALQYWPDADATLGNGQFQTSDIAEIKEGLVYLRGRRADFINVAGRKVSPMTIEAALRSHPAVRDCLVFGVTANANGSERQDTIVAAVSLVYQVSTRELKDHMLQQLPGWQVPRDWMFVDSLGHNARGKISRAEWARRYAGLRVDS